VCVDFCFNLSEGREEFGSQVGDEGFELVRGLGVEFLEVGLEECGDGEWVGVDVID
jgi:hypothetical protein